MSDAVAHELSVRTLVARYADAVCRHDVPAWRSTWAEDSEWQLLGSTLKGRAAITEYYESVVGRLEAVVQFAHGGIIEFDGADHAQGRWSITEHARMANGDPLFTIGLYEDDYIQSSGQWFFERRIFRNLYIGPPDLSSPFRPIEPKG